MFVDSRPSRIALETLSATIVVLACAGAYMACGWLLLRGLQFPFKHLSVAYALGSAIISAGLLVAMHRSREVTTLRDALRLAAAAAVIMATSLICAFAVTGADAAHQLRMLLIGFGLWAVLTIGLYLKSDTKGIRDAVSLAKGAGVLTAISVTAAFVVMRVEPWNLLRIAANSWSISGHP